MTRRPHHGLSSKGQRSMKMRLISVAIMAALSGSAEATTVIGSSDALRTFSDDTDYILEDDTTSNALNFTGKNGFSFTNYGTITVSNHVSAAVEISAPDATFINHGTLRAIGYPAILVTNNDHIILGTGSVLESDVGVYAIASLGTGNTLTLTSDDAETTVQNGDIVGMLGAYTGFKQLTSATNSHWQLGGNVELGGTTADTLKVAGELTVTGHIK